MVGPAFLLDVNALLALMWPYQEHHSVVEAWFLASGSRHWATCPITEAGVVRLLSNPSATPGALRVSEAVHLLETNLKQPGHVFWPDDIDLATSISMCKGSLQGYRQITDAYLLALALRRKAQLVTLDGGIASLAPLSQRARVFNLLEKAGRN
jgi:hypothetical protein